jgi:hypothetical protein
MSKEAFRRIPINKRPIKINDKRDNMQRSLGQS